MQLPGLTYAFAPARTDSQPPLAGLSGPLQLNRTSANVPWRLYPRGEETYCPRTTQTLNLEARTTHAL
eukprot:176514-Alexandrium_andersonii.AAC.1